jgi:hypothetical protein
MTEITIEKRTYVYDIGKWDPSNPVALSTLQSMVIARRLGFKRAF